MEITLEKIELVKDRTGVTYREAKEALEAAGGSVVDAIIDIEESADYDTEEPKTSGKGSFKDNELFEKIKETASKGNMSRIVVKKGDEVLLNFPLTVSILGAVIAPWGVIFGLIAAVGFNCRIEFVNDKGETTDVNGKVVEGYGKAKAKGQEYKTMADDQLGKLKDSDIYSNLKGKGEDALNKIKETDVYSDIREKSEDAIGRFKDVDLKDNLGSIKAKGEELFNKVRDNDQACDEASEEPVMHACDEASQEEEPVSDEVSQVLDEVEQEISGSDN